MLSSLKLTLVDAIDKCLKTPKMTKDVQLKSQHVSDASYDLSLKLCTTSRLFILHSLRENLKLNLQHFSLGARFLSALTDGTNRDDLISVLLTFPFSLLSPLYHHSIYSKKPHPARTSLSVCFEQRWLIEIWGNMGAACFWQWGAKWRCVFVCVLSNDVLMLHACGCVCESFRAEV